MSDAHRFYEFSPDGAQIVYQAKGPGASVGDLFLVDVATGETTQLTHLSPLVTSGLWHMGPTFAPDGGTVLFTRPTGNAWGLWSVPASGGKPTLVLRDAIGGRLSPDGRMIVYFEYNPSIEDSEFGGEMWIADADGTDARRLAKGWGLQRPVVTRWDEGRLSPRRLQRTSST